MRIWFRHVSKFAVNLEPSKLAKELEGKIIIDSQVIIIIFDRIYLFIGRAILD